MDWDDLLPGEYRLLLRIDGNPTGTDVFQTVCRTRADLTDWLRRLATHIDNTEPGRALNLKRL